MRNKFNILIFLIMVGVIAYLYFTKPVPADYTEYIKIGGKEYILLSKTRDTIWETKDSIITEYVPKYIKGDITYIDVPVDVDTNNILKDYFAKVFYRDSIPIDSVGYVIISDTLHRNRIYSRLPYFSYRIPTFTETIVVKDKPINKFYIGAGFDVATFNEFKRVYGSVLWHTKKDRIYNLDVGMVNVNSETFATYGVGVHWRIGKKKN